MAEQRQHFSRTRSDKQSDTREAWLQEKLAQTPSQPRGPVQTQSLQVLHKEQKNKHGDVTLGPILL